MQAVKRPLARDLQQPGTGVADDASASRLAPEREERALHDAVHGTATDLVGQRERRIAVPVVQHRQGLAITAGDMLQQQLVSSRIAGLDMLSITASAEGLLPTTGGL